MNNKRIKTLYGKYLPIILNFLIFVFAITGFVLSCIFATKDGYYHWLTRLLYFTQQSNIWIGVTSLIFAITLIKKRSEKSLKIISLLKFAFTVSITITGFIFCSVLAPFADYNVWTFASVLTHVVVPVLSILDFFTNKNLVKLDKKVVWCALIPLLWYFIFASVLCLLKIDFGRGEPYPYFFMNYYSNVGLFGFVFKWPPDIGSFYWIVFFFGFTYLLSTIYLKIHNVQADKVKN